MYAVPAAHSTMAWIPFTVWAWCHWEGCARSDPPGNAPCKDRQIWCCWHSIKAIGLARGAGIFPPSRWPMQRQKRRTLRAWDRTGTGYAGHARTVEGLTVAQVTYLPSTRL